MVSVLLRSFSTLNYRNLSAQPLQFPAGMISIVGLNGQGKTNFLEALYFVLTGRVDVHRLEQLLHHGEKEAYLRGMLQRQDGESLLEVGLGRGRRMVKVDGVRVRAHELLRSAAVWIRPEDNELVLGSPSTRRDFIDSLLSRMSPRYSANLALYDRTLNQRNAAIKQRQVWGLDVWDQQLAQVGIEIMQLRRRMMVRLLPLTQEAHQRLGGGSDLCLQLQETTTPDSYLADFVRRRAEEIHRGVTVAGPHRDDLDITLNGQRAHDFASRGQARTIALALRHAEYILLQERMAEPPVLLIDDFSAELDPLRREHLLDLARQAPQAFVTGTEALGEAQLAFQIQAGELTLC